MKKQICIYLLLLIIWNNTCSMLEPIEDSEVEQLLKTKNSSIRYKNIKPNLPLKIAVIVDEPIAQEQLQEENRRKCRDKALCCALASFCSIIGIFAISLLATTIAIKA